MTNTATPTTAETSRVLEVLNRLGGEAPRSRLADRAKTKDFPRERALEVIEVLVTTAELSIDGARVSVPERPRPRVTLSKRGKGGGSVWVLADGKRVGYAVRQENGSWLPFRLDGTPVGTESPTRLAAAAFLV